MSCRIASPRGSNSTAKRQPRKKGARGRPFLIARLTVRRLQLRIQALQLGMQLVQRVDVGLGRRDDDVGVRALPVHDAAGLRQPHRHLALRIGAARDVVDRIQQQLRAALDELSIALNDASTGPLPLASAGRSLPSSDNTILANGYSPVSECAVSDTRLVVLVLDVLEVLFGDQRLQILVEDLALLVGELLEARERGVERLFRRRASMPISCRRVLNALRPDSLPSVSRFVLQPTVSALMIS